MVTGRVIRFDEVKGYGFITPSEGGEDVFVHANEITDRGLRVSAGAQVAFRVLEGDRGEQITELLLTAAPQLTGSGIVELRGRLLEFARKNGWVE
jgi:cold shock protein